MVNYTCIRCGYTTNDKSKMKTHFNRKTVCKPKIININLDEYKEKILNGEIINLDKYTQNIPNIYPNSDICIPNLYPEDTQKEKGYFCEFCKKELSSYKNLWRHLKTCKEKKKDDEEKENMLNLIEMLNKQLEDQRQEFKLELNKRNKQITDLIKKSGINIGTQNIQQNIQQNIKVLAYKDTDISHLTDQDYLYCLNRSNMCIPNLIKKIHFNPKKPENQNIYISNIKNKYIMVYDGDKWNLSNQSETIEDLIDTNEFVIEQKLEEWLENGKEFPQIMKKFNRYLEKKEKDEVKNAIKEEIKLVLYNNRKIYQEEVL